MDAFIAKEDGVNPPTCEPCRVCEAGMRLVSECAKRNNTACEPCEEGSFSSDPMATACTSHATCSPGQYEAEAPTSSSNRVCLPCPAGTTDSDGIATTACEQCSEGSYAPEGSSASCSSSVLLCPVGTADRDMDPATPCQDCLSLDAYQAEAGSVECLPAEQCAPGTGVLRQVTSTANRECAPCLLNLSFSDNTRNDVGCKPLKQCEAGEEESIVPTTTRDRECAPCQVPEGSPLRGRPPYPSPAPFKPCSALSLQFAVRVTRAEGVLW